MGVDSIRLCAISDLFSAIIEEPCFNQLRYLFYDMFHVIVIHILMVNTCHYDDIFIVTF